MAEPGAGKTRVDGTKTIARMTAAHKAQPLPVEEACGVHGLPLARDYEGGRITKEELDALSTCEVAASSSGRLYDTLRVDAQERCTREAQ